MVDTCQTARPDQQDVDGDGDITELDPGLCPPDQRKLVRVGARIESPTVFMRLLGFGNITLSAVAVSETAVLDVVIVMDVSESMLDETSYDDYAAIGMGKVYVPPRMGGNSFNPEDPSENGTIYQRMYREHRTLYNLSLIGTATGTPGYCHPGVSEVNDGGDAPFGYLDDTFCATNGAAPTLQRFWDDFIIHHSQKMITDRLFYPTGGSAGGNGLDYVGLPVNQTVQPSNPSLHVRGNDANPNYTVGIYDLPGTSNQNHPRLDCRVRFWPYSINIPMRETGGDRLVEIYDDLGVSWPKRINGEPIWDGFVPSYNFYGCCNDPTTGGRINPDTGQLEGINGGAFNFTGNWNEPDNRFNDLICQPFKQARDATRQFLDRIDFERGDRVAFVTFDRGSYLIDPDGAFGRQQPGSPTAEACASESANYAMTDIDGDGTEDEMRSQLTHMIESDCRARITLDKDIGVRAEPNYYNWNENGGGWEGFAEGLDDEGLSRQIFYNHRPLNPSQASIDTSGRQAYNTYPVKGNCPMQNASLEFLTSRYSLWQRGDYATNGSPDINRPTLPPAPGLYRTMIPTPWQGPWGSAGLDVRNSYELWTTCRGTNIGAALRAASNALLDPNTTRRTGAVWVIIFLGDGAAGASDPIRQEGFKLSDGRINNNGDISAYADWGPNPATWAESWTNYIPQPLPNPPAPTTFNVRYGSVNPANRTEYGVFGLCPLGYPDARSRLTRQLGFGEQPTFPYCSDTDPFTRNFCGRPRAAENTGVGGQCSGTSTYGEGFSPGSRDRDYDCDPTGEPDFRPGETVEDYNLRKGNLFDVDVGAWADNLSPATSECSPLYDVDDYARDWADFIGLARGSGDEQLPSIFTIGFGLTFANNIDGTGQPVTDDDQLRQQNPEDFLGEELLRYVADVGDNFQIDIDHQQDYLDDGIINNSVLDWGPRGVCEAPGNPGDYAPLPPRQSCGNYYNAPNQAELQLVFEDIASRMFTRLTG